MTSPSQNQSKVPLADFTCFSYYRKKTFKKYLLGNNIFLRYSFCIQLLYNKSDLCVIFKKNPYFGK